MSTPISSERRFFEVTLTFRSPAMMREAAAAIARSGSDIAAFSRIDSGTASASDPTTANSRIAV